MNIEEARQLAEQGFYEKNGKRITWAAVSGDEVKDAVLGYVEQFDERARKEHEAHERRATTQDKIVPRQDDRFGFRSEPGGLLPVAVVITAHNYAHFLRSCLAGWMDQTYRPTTIIVVDDSSNDHPEKIVKDFPSVRYERVEFRDANKARNAGFELTVEPLVIFFDADNVPTKELCRLHADAMVDRRMAIAYPILQRFGLINSPVRQPKFDPYLLLEHSYIDTSSIWRRDAVAQAGGWRPDVPLFQDWDLARRIIKLGWLATPSPGVVLYRTHEAQATHDKNADLQYYPRIIEDTADLTVFTPFAGREFALPKYFNFIETLDWPRKRLHLFFYDNSTSETFGERLRSFLAGFSCASMRYLRDDRPARTSNVSYAHTEQCFHVAQRMMEIGNQMRESVNTELVLMVEDDVIPPAEAARILTRDLLPDVAMVAACYPSRFSGQPIGRKIKSITPLQIDPEFLAPKMDNMVFEIGLCGTGCTLIRQRTLRIRSFRCYRDHTGHGADYLFSRDSIMTGRKILFDGRVKCEHLQK